MAGNVNKDEPSLESMESTKRKHTCSPDDLPGHLKQTSRQIKARTLSYSADDLNKADIDDTKVDQILARKPGVTFNIQELVCSVLKDDSFIDKIVPKICDSVNAKLEEKYYKLVNEVIKPLQDTVVSQEAQLKQQKSTIDKHVTKLVQHENTIKQQGIRISEQEKVISSLNDTVTDLQNQVFDLDIRLEDQEQYSRRTSLRFNNIPCPDPRNIRQMDTDKIILDLCNKDLGLPDVTLDDIGRTHPIGQVRGDKVQVIARFISYRKRSEVYSAKRKLKDHKDKIFITENLTIRRRKIMDELNFCRIKGKIKACWSQDGKLFAIGLNSKRTDLITCMNDIRLLLEKYPVPLSDTDNEQPLVPKSESAVPQTSEDVDENKQ